MPSRLNPIVPNCLLALGALVLCTLLPARAGAIEGGDDVSVSVTREGDVVRARADFFVSVGASQAFAVLIDYDHMTDFLPGVVKSKVIQRSPDRLVVFQSLQMKLGPVSIPFEAVRQVDLEGSYKLVSQVISGTISKAKARTTLMEGQGKTLVTYESEATLSSWIPTCFGAGFISAQIREQLTHMRAEMLRRQSSVAK